MSSVDVIHSVWFFFSLQDKYVWIILEYMSFFFLCLRSYCPQCPGDPYGSGLWRFSKTPGPGPARFVTTRSSEWAKSKVQLGCNCLTSVNQYITEEQFRRRSPSHQKIYCSFLLIACKFFFVDGAPCLIVTNLSLVASTDQVLFPFRVGSV